MNGLTISFYGSSLLSAYWNGAATYYRGLIRRLSAGEAVGDQLARLDDERARRIHTYAHRAAEVHRVLQRGAETIRPPAEVA